MSGLDKDGWTRHERQQGELDRDYRQIIDKTMEEMNRRFSDEFDLDFQENGINVTIMVSEIPPLRKGDDTKGAIGAVGQDDGTILAHLIGGMMAYATSTGVSPEDVLKAIAKMTGVGVIASSEELRRAAKRAEQAAASEDDEEDNGPSFKF